MWETSFGSDAKSEAVLLERSISVLLFYSTLCFNSTMFFTFVSIPNIVLWFLLGTHIQTHEEVAIKLVSSLLRFYICFFFLASCACY